MSDYSEIDETFNFYERRYNLTKMAMDCGIAEKDFNKLSTKDKFLVLSYKLKEVKKVNLASFFFGKLFEVSGNMEALLNKVDCLLELAEYDEAIRFNNIGFELYLEDPSIDVTEVEKKLQLQKALIAFYTEKFSASQWICEDSIVKFKTEEFYHLLCSVFIAQDDFHNGIKLFRKYASKLGEEIEFFMEVFLYLVGNNQIDKAIYFLQEIYKISDKQKKNLRNYISNYYLINKDRIDFKKYFVREMKINENKNINSL